MSIEHLKEKNIDESNNSACKLMPIKTLFNDLMIHI